MAQIWVSGSSSGDEGQRAGWLTWGLRGWGGTEAQLPQSPAAYTERAPRRLSAKQHLLLLHPSNCHVVCAWRSSRQERTTYLDPFAAEWCKLLLPALCLQLCEAHESTKLCGDLRGQVGSCKRCCHCNNLHVKQDC